MLLLVYLGKENSSNRGTFKICNQNVDPSTTYP
jgi:hypothetical protein